jgi:hypothetical protein
MRRNILIAILFLFVLSSCCDSQCDSEHVYVYNGPAEEFSSEGSFVIDVIVNDTIYLTDKL